MTSRLVELVDAYSLHVYPAVLQQHEGNSVSSPLGIWLLLAACASAADSSDRESLESVLGCSVAEASELLADFLAEPPPAVATAVALWVTGEDETPRLREWRGGLPGRVVTGPIPAQTDADAWVERETLGLVRHFPATIDALTRLVLSSTLATKVSWDRPFGVVEAKGHLGVASPWSSKVERLLHDGMTGEYTKLAHTEAAGVVAVHTAYAVEDLAILSVSAESKVPRSEVFRAAHEVVAVFRASPPAVKECSLFDLPLGDGHSWTLTERQVATDFPGQRFETIRGATLPAWTAKDDLDLKCSELFGTKPALAALLGLIGPHSAGDETEAKQSAVASFTRYGFEAAAVSAFGIACTAPPQPQELGVERIADLRFDHPFVAVAVVQNQKGLRATQYGLPVFSAWVSSPQEVDDEPKE